MSIKTLNQEDLRLLKDITGVCPLIILVNRMESKN